MIRLSLPFLLSRIEQIPQPLVAERDLLLEANVFDGDELVELSQRDKLKIQLLAAAKIGSIRAVHFPTENADYLSSKKLQTALLKTIEVMSDIQIPYLVLHTNYIKPAKTFDYKTLPETRERSSLYATLASRAAKYGVTICIENLPVIGNAGDDFDSVFVFPEDFHALPKTDAKIAWDIGHWAYTCASMNYLSTIYPSIPSNEHSFFDFLELAKEIDHYHFSSFVYPNPSHPEVCNEGTPPQQGDFDAKKLAQACRRIHAMKKEIAMTLEVKEADYRVRRNFQKTLKWFDAEVFS